MLRVPGYVIGPALGHTEPPRVFAATAEVDGRPVVLRRSTATGVVARDGLRSAVARVAGVRCSDLMVPSTVVTTPEGLVLVYDGPVAAVWDGLADFAEPAAAVLAVVRAVAALHEAGLAHGALVPEAVWLDADGTVRLACLPGPEEADMSDDQKNLQRFAARIAVGHPALVEAVEIADAPAPRDLLSRLAPFATPVVPVPTVAAAPDAAPMSPLAGHVPQPQAHLRAQPQPPVVVPPVVVPPVFVPPIVAPPAFVPAVPAATMAAAPLVDRAPAVPDRDVLRAPRPNRPISRPAAPAKKRGLRPLTVAVVGIAVLLSAAGIGVAAAQITRDTVTPLVVLPPPPATSTPTPSPTPSPSAASTFVPPTPTVAPTPGPAGDASWIPVMANLDSLRDAAFVTTDPTMLDAVYVDGSNAGVTEHAAMSKLRDTGVHADGLQLMVREVRLVKKGARHVTLRVVDELPAYRLVDAHGETVRTEPARGVTTWRIVLDRSPGGWRIASIEHATT